MEKIIEQLSWYIGQKNVIETHSFSLKDIFSTLFVMAIAVIK